MLVVVGLLGGSKASTPVLASAPRFSSSLQCCRLCTFDNVVLAPVGSVEVDDTVVNEAAVADEAASNAMAMPSETEASVEREDMARFSSKGRVPYG